MTSEELRKAGLKVTLPRLKILEILQEQNEASHHMTAENIYKALLTSGEEIGLATVYRVLAQFEAAGLVKRHYFEGSQSIFEISNGNTHDHIICMQCGKIFEFCDELVDQRQREVARSQGFELSDRSLILYGSCTRPNCPHLEEVDC